MPLPEWVLRLGVRSLVRAEFSDMLSYTCWQTLLWNLSGEGVAWFQGNLSGSQLAAASSIRDRWCHIDLHQQHVARLRKCSMGLLVDHVGPELSEQLSDAVLWQCVQILLVPRGWVFIFLVKYLRSYWTDCFEISYICAWSTEDGSWYPDSHPAPLESWHCHLLCWN